MADRRIVVEHTDGRRVAVDEADFDDAAANPFNAARSVVSLDNDTGSQVTHEEPARPLDDHVSLKAERFKVVGVIDKDGHEQGIEGG